MAYKEEFLKYAINLVRSNKIQIWEDGLIQAGMDWDYEIKQNLENADIVILLVSQYFIASNYIYEKELKTSIDKFKNSGTQLIPVLISQSMLDNWSLNDKNDKEEYQMSSFQFLPGDKETNRLKPINQWQYPEEAWIKVIEQIDQYVT